METKMLMIAIVCAAAAGLAALGQAVKAEAAVAAEPAKILIAYYSYSGNTKAVAEQIQKATGGEIDVYKRQPLQVPQGEGAG